MQPLAACTSLRESAAALVPQGPALPSAVEGPSGCKLHQAFIAKVVVVEAAYVEEYDAYLAESTIHCADLQHDLDVFDFLIATTKTMYDEQEEYDAYLAESTIHFDYDYDHDSTTITTSTTTADK
jgi:hypothetical protein